MDDIPLADDLVRGAGNLAIEIFGEDTRLNRRKIFYLASKPDNPLGVFRVGATICGRKSVLRRVGLPQ